MNELCSYFQLWRPEYLKLLLNMQAIKLNWRFQSKCELSNVQILREQDEKRETKTTTFLSSKMDQNACIIMHSESIILFEMKIAYEPTITAFSCPFVHYQRTSINKKNILQH